MIRSQRVAESFARTEQELVLERGAALTRIAGRLEALIESLVALRLALGTSAGEERSCLVRRYESIRRDALRQRWYLEVQRESIGLRKHHVLDEIYPIPPPICPSDSSGPYSQEIRRLGENNREIKRQGDK